MLTISDFVSHMFIQLCFTRFYILTMDYTLYNNNNITKSCIVWNHRTSNIIYCLYSFLRFFSISMWPIKTANGINIIADNYTYTVTSSVNLFLSSKFITMRWVLTGPEIFTPSAFSSPVVPLYPAFPPPVRFIIIVSGGTVSFLSI